MRYGLFSIVFGVVVFTAFTLGIVALWYGTYNWDRNFEQDEQQRADVITLNAVDTMLLLANLGTNITITIVNNTLRMEISQATTNLTILINGRLASINGISGTNPAGAITINTGPGLSITPSSSPNTLDLNTTAVLTIEGQQPSAVGDIDFVGQCGLGITPGPLPHQVTLDACTLQTTVTNLAASDASQTAQIANLTTILNSFQSQIDVIENAGQNVTIALNQTISINMTLTQVITEILMLQQAVAALQDVINNQTVDSVQPGTMFAFTGTTVPAGYLLCDGQQYLTADYPELFAVISTAHCASPCTGGTFAVPNMTGRIPVAADGGATFTSRGIVVGAVNHTLTSAELPAHTHSISSEPGHQHGIVLANGTAYNGLTDQGCFGASTSTPSNQNNGENGFEFEQLSPPPSDQSICALGNNPKHIRFTATPPGGLYQFGTGAVPNGAHSHGGNTGSAGSGQSFSIVQPTIVIASYIIKT